MIRRGIVLLLALSTASLGFSQSNGSGNGQTSTSTSTNTINVVANTGSEGRQLIQAMPGSGMTMIPGITLGNSPWKFYFPKTGRCIPMTQLMAADNGHAKIKVYKVAKPIDRKGSDQNDVVCLVPWWPDDLAPYADDRKIGSATGTGKDGYPDDASFFPTLKKLVMKTGTRRVAVLRRYLGQDHTKTISGGVGGASSITADNNVGGSGAFGISAGSSTTSSKDPVEFDFRALNDGPIDLPPPQIRDDKPAQHEEQQAPPPPAQLAPAAPVQTLRIEIVGASAQLSAPTLSVPMSAQMAPAMAQNAERCDLLQFAAHFDFNQSVMDSKERAEIANVVGTWLENHSTCKVQIEGHASTEGSFDYNAALARKRAKAVYDILAENKKIVGQLTQFVSLSKDKSSSEHNPDDRRVILRVIGDSSGR